jgi:hypothetical protein
LFEKLKKFQISKINFPENFSFVAFKGEAAGVAQISSYGGGT